jgi:hypothetical protein
VSVSVNVGVSVSVSVSACIYSCLLHTHVYIPHTRTPPEIATINFDLDRLLNVAKGDVQAWYVCVCV